MARRGHVSVVIDRLGYGKSGKPPGNSDSYAGQATVAHQIIEQLRSGDYDLAGKGRNPAFEVIGLAGHSASVFVAQLEAAIFDDADALVLMSLGDLYPSPLAVTAFASHPGHLPRGRRAVRRRTGAPQYAYFGQTDADFQRAHLFNVEPKIAEIATARRSRDPCGESGTALTSIVADVLNVPRIGVPVLLLNGKNDALFPPPAGTCRSRCTRLTRTRTSRRRSSRTPGTAFCSAARPAKCATMSITGWTNGASEQPPDSPIGVILAPLADDRRG